MENLELYKKVYDTMKNGVSDNVKGVGLLYQTVKVVHKEDAIKGTELMKEEVLPLIQEIMKVTEDKEELTDIFAIYEETLRLTARNDFESYLIYLDLNQPRERQFYINRRSVLKEFVDAVNDAVIYKKYDGVFLSLPPRIGKTTVGIRVLMWSGARNPLKNSLALSYSSAVVQSFYSGMFEVDAETRHGKVFPEAPIVKQSAERYMLWMGKERRYATTTFRSIDASLHGATECEEILYMDDLVSGTEEAYNIDRLEKLWTKVTVDALSRAKVGFKIIGIGTRFSVHDPLSRYEHRHINNPRWKFIKIEALDPVTDESNFDFLGGFTTEYYRNLRDMMDNTDWQCLYQQNPIERDGQVFGEKELMYYDILPEGTPDAIISVGDTKGTGKDNASFPIAYVYGDRMYIEDVVFDNSLPEVWENNVFNKYIKHGVTYTHIEANNGGHFVAESLRKKFKSSGHRITIQTTYTSQRKLTKINTEAMFIKECVYFKDKSQYAPNSEYGRFMANIYEYNAKGTAKHDDAPDSVAMLVDLFRKLTGAKVRVADRKTYGW